MLRSYAKEQQAEGSEQGLLVWQILLLFSVTGLFAPAHPVPSLCAAALLLVYFKFCSRLQGLLIKAFCAFLLGVLVAHYLQPPPISHPPFLDTNRKKILLSAVVDSVRPQPQRRLQIVLSEVFIHSQGQKKEIREKVVWTWQEASRWPSPGQQVHGQFRLKPIQGRQNFGGWDSKRYWARKGVYYRTFSLGDQPQLTFSGPLKKSWRLRLFLRQQILRYTHEGGGQGLLLALLMGDRFQTNYQALDLVRRASLAHSLALSGLHVGFVVSLAWGLVWLSGRCVPAVYLILPRQKWIILIAAPLILIYLWLGQAKPSLVRAALMFFFWGFLCLQGRRNVLTDGLFFALLTLICLNPLDIHDLGLQLSFIAVAGIILAIPVFRSWIRQRASENPWVIFFHSLLAILAVSLIANLVLLPLLIKNFGEWSPHLYLNVLWLPTLGFVVLPLGLIGLGLSVIPGLSPCGGALLLSAGQVLDLLLGILQFLEAKDWLKVLVLLRPYWPQALGYWICVSSFFLWWTRSRNYPKWIPVLGLCLLLGPGLGQHLVNLSPGVKMDLFDVGQGQSVFLQARHNRSVLIDGGGSWNRDYDLGRHILSPALTWGRSPEVDTVILTHDDYDHLRGLYYILQHYRVGQFVFNGNWPQGWDGEHLRLILKSRGIASRSLMAGEALKLTHRLRLTALHPPRGYQAAKDNDNSLVLRLSYKHQGLILLPGDIEIKGLERILSLKFALQAQVLLLPHHGSRTSFCPALYSRVDPELALVSCGYRNFYNFPHEEVREAFQAAGIPFYSTAQSGQISLDWNFTNHSLRLDSKIGPDLLLTNQEAQGKAGHS